MQCTVIHDEFPPEWDRFLNAHPHGLVYGTCAWARALRETGRSVVLIIAREDGLVRGGAVVAVRKISPFGCLAEAPAGILVNLEEPAAIARHTNAILDAIRGYANERSALACELVMHLPSQIGDDRLPHALEMQRLLREWGAVASPPQLGTYIQNIDLDDEALLQSLPKNCRRDIRRAKREGVLVEDTDKVEALGPFYAAYRQLCLAKDLSLAPSAFMIQGLGEVMLRGAVRLFRATYRGREVNSALVSTIGIPRYLFGACPPCTRDKSTPPTGQILHYEIMRWQRDRGAKSYDWGESPGPVPVREHPNYGVWRFKHSFGGTYVHQLGHWICVFRPIRFSMLERARRTAPTVRKIVRYACFRKP